MSWTTKPHHRWPYLRVPIISISHGTHGSTSKAPLPGLRVFWRTTFPVGYSEETDNSSLASNEDHFEGATAGVSSRDPVHPFKGILEKVWVGVIGMTLAS
jgi:hypothetical protein